MSSDIDFLIKRFRAGDCVAFIGAGFSAPLRMPLWGALLDKLIDLYVLKAANNRHPLRCPSHPVIPLQRPFPTTSAMRNRSVRT